MSAPFQKTTYHSHRQYGFLLNHTVGPDAGDSTLSYLHHTTDYLLICFLRGRGSVKVEGHHYDLSPGDLILLDPAELFHFTVCGDSYHERIVLHIGHTFLSQFPLRPDCLLAPFSARKKGVGNRIPAQIAQTIGARACLDALFELARSPAPADTLLALCKVVELLAALSRGLSPLPLSSPSYAESDPLIGRVLDYLNEHFCREITLSGVAERFSVTTSHLSHRFREYTGMSLWNYVILRRLHAFNELLGRSRSIEEACYQVGFQNYSNFFRLYKKHMGMTPAQYKRQLASGTGEYRPQFPNHSP